MQRSPATKSAPRVGSSGFRRIARIHDLLSAKRRVTALDLAAEFEVAPRTIKRDIEWLKNERGAPVEWDRAAHTYRYTAPFDLCTGLRLDADEALALVLAGRTFAAWADSPLGRALTNALGKVARFAGTAISLPAADLHSALYQPEHDAPALDAEHRHFARLLDLVLQRREVELVYQKPKSSRPERRRVRPLHLAYLDHRWTLVAEDPARAGWRKFLLGRIRELIDTGRTFAPPSLEKIRAYLAGSLGRFTGDKLHEVRLRFTATAAPYVRERPWHASQTLRERPGGVVETTLHLNNLVDVQRRVLSCGRHVEVLSPPELRAAIAAELAALARTYAPELGAENPAVSEEKPSR